jgi:hypothetical protein
MRPCARQRTKTKRHRHQIGYASKNLSKGERRARSRMPAMPPISSHLLPSDFRFQLLKAIRGKHERFNYVGATVAG